MSRLAKEFLSFLQDNLDLIDTIGNGRKHATMTIEVQDGVIHNGEIALKFRRRKEGGMSILKIDTRND